LLTTARGTLEQVGRRVKSLQVEILRDSKIFLMSLGNFAVHSLDTAPSGLYCAQRVLHRNGRQSRNGRQDEEWRDRIDG
jgi:hypothetical protein